MSPYARRLLPIALILSALLGPVAQAAPNLPVLTDPPTQAADQKVVDDAFAAAGKGGFAALVPLVPVLEEVLGRAPASYPTAHDAGDAIHVHGELKDYLVLSAILSKAYPGRSVVAMPNVYPLAALLLTSLSVEAGRQEAALAYADRGLAMQPHNGPLVSERAAALVAAHRYAEGVAYIDAELGSNDIGLLTSRSMILRKRGFSLVELGRLDEGRAAYVASLQLEPGNEGAKAEIRYIDGLKAGKAPTTPYMKAPLSTPEPTPGKVALDKP
jgi:tetratricopeptide (TPR) repeat protein